MEVKTKNKKQMLDDAKKNKKDEFYTLYEDVAMELDHYNDQLKGSHILAPCDYNFNDLTKEQRDEFFKNGLVQGINDGFAFSRYLNSTQERVGYASLTYSHYNKAKSEGIPFQESIREFAKKHPDGIVITNPPFSLFREFIDVIIKCNLRFLVIGHQNSITYKEIFKLFIENKIWMGHGFKSSVGFFKSNLYEDYAKATEHKEGKIRVSGVKWFTNLDTKPRHQRFYGSHEFENINNYQKYDNYDAINIDKVKDIPEEYYEPMGVPITFLDKYNPKQFEIIHFRKGDDGKDLKVNGKDTYCRIIIRRKKDY